MTPRTRPSRVAEWADLVGDSVPETVFDADPDPDEPAPSDPTRDPA